jgi:hypothetical protein
MIKYLGGGVRLLAKRELDAVACAPTPSNPIERRAERLQQRPVIGVTTGGSPTTGRTKPPAASSSRRASAAVTPRRAMTIASFTLPSARSIAARASSRLTPVHSITMRWPRSFSLSLNAIRSTIRLP